MYFFRTETMKKKLSGDFLVNRTIVSKPWYVLLLRFIFQLILNVVALALALHLVGIQIEMVPGGLTFFTLLIAGLNALLRPLLVKLTLPITIATFGLITFVVNGLVFMVAAWIAPGVAFNSLWQAVVLSTVVTLISWLISTLLSIDDADTYFNSAVKRAGIARKLSTGDTKEHGILFLEIDGLAASVLQQALRLNIMPTLAALLAQSHAFTSWETDLPAQTCASQRGILFGDNKDVIGFRWYDRKKKFVVTASHPKHVGLLESAVDHGQGLLAVNGASIGNMFSGGAELTAFTTAAASRPDDRKNAYDPLSYYFNNPYNYVRTFVMVLYEFFQEAKDIVVQSATKREPRIKRGVVSALQRAVMCVFVPDIAVQTTVGEMFAGRDVIYTTYAGYDEMSHLAGIDRPETLRALKKVDSYLYQLLLAAKVTPRPYHLVLLSDHGQSMGETFQSAFSMSVGDLVKSGCIPSTEIKEIAGVDEVSMVVSDVLSDIRKSLQSTFSTQLFSKVFKKSTTDESSSAVVLDPTSRELVEANNEGKGKFAQIPEVLVQVGGNLGMVYFTNSKKRLLLEDIQKKQPKLIETLVNHPGVGFIFVDSKKGPVAIGKSGKVYLHSGLLRKPKVVGENPLTVFGENTLKHLQRVHEFSTCPDILINSTFNPSTETIYCFEPQCGAHGALGGPQNHPFLIHPKSLKLSDQKIIGAENIYKQFMSWVELVTQRS